MNTPLLICLRASQNVDPKLIAEIEKKINRAFDRN